MPRIDFDTPKMLKPYIYHGVELQPKQNADNIVGVCPFCQKEGKFSIHVEDGRWRCFRCNVGTANTKSTSNGGNLNTFLKLLWQYSSERTTDYSELITSRKLLSGQTLERWGICRSILSSEWIVPGYNSDKKLVNLYRYILDRSTKKYRLMGTPEVNHCLFGLQHFDNKKTEIWVCEGLWDALVLEELLGHTKKNGDGTFSVTNDPKKSMLHKVNVLGSPGCSVFRSNWLDLFGGKEVTICFDNDYPKKTQNGQVLPPAGTEGVKRIINMMARHGSPPAYVKYLCWGKKGYSNNYPDGSDLRDWLTGSFGINGADTLKKRITYFTEMSNSIKPTPSDWVGGGEVTAKPGEVKLACVPCDKWTTLIAAWKKAMRWTEGLDRALSVMLSSIASTMSIGDQLWIKVVGPPSSGKSTLCEALSVNSKYTLARSCIRGFHSGYKSDADGSTDHSLIAELTGKTLITKDGDTLLQSPNIGQILSEARDLYDGVSRSSYRHGITREYNRHRTTWILCGTSSLRILDTSELGERFLDCIIMREIDPSLEDEILRKAVQQAVEAVSTIADNQQDGMNSNSMICAMQLTGGYIDWLRSEGSKLLKNVQITPEAGEQCMMFGKFVSFMRARPSIKQEELAERELSARLVKQHVRLACCLGVVLNRPIIDEEVMRRVRQVALDTARGRVFEITRRLYDNYKRGLDTKSLALLCNESEPKLKLLLRFLGRIGAVEAFLKKDKVMLSSRPLWRLTPLVKSLYEKVVLGK